MSGREVLPMYEKILNGLMSPHKLVFKTWHALDVGSFRARLAYDVFERPHYAYCLFHAARLAHALGHDRISAMEFGVAGGRGLMALEDLALRVQKEVPVEIEIYGFDTGEGLPEPVDYRDLPYIWKAGFYRMDQEALRSKLKLSKLVLGDVRDTVPNFFETYNAAPLGAAFFDLDFWSSTVEAFRILEAPHERLLPRVFCYCDDVISVEYGGILNEHVGQLAAIRDYNRKHEMRKLAQIAGMSRTRKIPAAWNDQIYVHHTFEHPRYNEYVHPDPDRQLPL
ncbi:MAG: hypothetical protein ACLFWF_02875 [Alphaproteobacteria bacterium]